MPTRKYPLEEGGPKRLTVSWRGNWNDFVVELDGAEVGRVEGGIHALELGDTFRLPDKRKLRVRLVTEKSWWMNLTELRLYLDKKPLPGSEKIPLPKWAYAFVVACVLIPVATLGGGIPALIGFAGAVACASLARDASKSAAARVAACAGMTVLAWIMLGSFVYIIRN